MFGDDGFACRLWYFVPDGGTRHPRYLVAVGDLDIFFHFVWTVETVLGLDLLTAVRHRGLCRAGQRLRSVYWVK